MVKKLKVKVASEGSSNPAPIVIKVGIEKLEETAMTAEALEIKKKLNEVIEKLNTCLP